MESVTTAMRAMMSSSLPMPRRSYDGTDDRRQPPEGTETMTDEGRSEHAGRAARDRIPEALVARAVQLDDAMREKGPGETYLFWEFDPPLLSEVGYRLIEFDREARRETAPGDGGPGDRPRPLRIGEAGFRVVDASPGSLDLLVQAIGATEQILRSDPVQFVIQVIGAIQAVRAVRSWIGRRGKLDGTITAAACRRILAEAGDQAEAGEQSIGWDDHGPKVTGSARVTIVRQYADGSYDLVMVEPGSASPAGSG